MNAVDLLGRGWTFPVAPAVTDRALPVVAGPEKVRLAIWLILMTSPGERVMRPDFGCGLQRFVMEPNTVATRALIQREVATALNRWEPRIRVTQVAVDPGADPAEVVVTIRYAHRLDGRPDLLVVPFSLAVAR